MEYVKQNEIEPFSLGEGRSRYHIHTDNLMMVVFDFEDGPYGKPNPPHSHPHEQISYITSGRVAYFIEGEKVVLEPGDMITIPPGVSHTVQLMSEKARLVDAFHPVREDFLG